MTRKSSITIVTVLLLIVLLLSACSESKPKKQGPTFTEFEQAMTNEDSVAVTNLVNQFFEHAQNGQIEDAVAMLYKNNMDSVNKEPELLDTKDIEQVKHLLNSLPVRSHTIDYIKFSEANKNEVKCTALIMEGHDNVPDVTTVFYFKPVNYLGTWKLCLMDSNHGDRTIIDGNQRDSMKREYQIEMREKYQNEH